jgi:hypothetical protein
MNGFDGFTLRVGVYLTSRKVNLTRRWVLAEKRLEIDLFWARASRA